MIRKSPLESTGGSAPTVDTLAMLSCLRSAVAEALERKRRLGQYFVQWSPEGPRLTGPDAPKEPPLPSTRS
jgi:hypothetical protein